MHPLHLTHSPLSLPITSRWHPSFILRLACTEKIKQHLGIMGVKYSSRVQSIITPPLAKRIDCRKAFRILETEFEVVVLEYQMGVPDENVLGIVFMNQIHCNFVQFFYLGKFYRFRILDQLCQLQNWLEIVLYMMKQVRFCTIPVAVI